MTPRAKGFANGSLYLQRMNHETLLMVADSEHDSNVLYATGMFVPDPFIYFSRNGTGYMVLNDLEIDRARKQASHCRVVSWSNCCKQLRQQKVHVPVSLTSFASLLKAASGSGLWCLTIFRMDWRVNWPGCGSK